MTKIETIENRISKIKQYLKICKGYQDHTKEDLQKDHTLKGAVERYLYLACQASIDLAEAFISYRKFRKPSSNRESFSILGEENILDQDLKQKLMNMTGFRNIIAHEYADLDLGLMMELLKLNLVDIEAFMEAVEQDVKVN
jgi:uncharacterized protein YutE (UPF0331/DUF86 family)